MAFGKEKIKWQLKIKQLDDVFNRLIISLERLEAFLEIERLQGDISNPLRTTAVGTSRDLHNDEKNIPTRDSFLGEVQLQLTALYYQTKMDDIELFNTTMKYFLKDILQWYGGRSNAVPYNEVDAFILPIIVALNRQVKSVADLMQIVKKYVADIKSISDYNEKERFNAVISGWTAYQIALDRNAQETHQFLESNSDVVLTSHVRANETDGYKRLVLALTTLFDQPLPAKILCRTIKSYLPEVAESFPQISEDNIETIISARLNGDFCDQEAHEIENTSNAQDESPHEDSTPLEDIPNTSTAGHHYRMVIPLSVDNPYEGTPHSDITFEEGKTIENGDTKIDSSKEASNEKITYSNSKIAEQNSDESFHSTLETDKIASAHFETESLSEALKVTEIEQSLNSSSEESSSFIIEEDVFESDEEPLDSSELDYENKDEESFFARLANKVKSPFSKNK